MALPPPPPPPPYSSSPNPNPPARLFINNLPRAPQPPPPPHQQLPNNTTNNLNYQNIAPRVPQLLSSSPDTTPSHHHPIVQYPLVSSGRGRLIPNNNNKQQQLPPAVYVPHSVRVGYGYPPGNPIRPAHLPQQQQQQQQQQGFVVVGNNNSNNNNNVVKGFPFSSHPKASSSPSLVFDSNGHKDPRDRNRDDSLATVRDRKVRIVDGTSLYAQCRSWLRNGLPEETQPHYVDGLRSLPKPLPMATPSTDAHSPKEKEGGGEEKDEENVDHLSSEDLLQRHIKRAKKVRARLREERLQRIARYKMRLALLLPPMVEQQIRNDTSSAGN